MKVKTLKCGLPKTGLNMLGVNRDKLQNLRKKNETEVQFLITNTDT